MYKGAACIEFGLEFGFFMLTGNMEGPECTSRLFKAE